MDKNKSKQLLKLPRHELGQVIQVLTGHAHLSYHDHVINKTTSPVCRFCEEEDETAFHLAAECDGLLVKRFECFETRHPDEVRAHWTVGQLTRFIRTAMGGLLRPRVDQLV